MSRKVLILARLGFATALVASVLVVSFLGGSRAASATSYTGGLSPTIYSGKADVNGSGTVTGADDSNKFYGDTSIIDGLLDCDAWGTTYPADVNKGDLGSGVIDTADDCRLVGFDGTVDGVTINVVDGVFQVANGALPTVFNGADPDNDDIGDSDFAWSTIDGRVDSHGDEVIDGEDCTFGLIGVTVDVGFGEPKDGFDILGEQVACGFAKFVPTADYGLVDLDDDVDISVHDTCLDGCFFGYNVSWGRVLEPAVAGPAGPTGPTGPQGSPGPVGSPGPAGVSGLATVSSTSASDSSAKTVSATCATGKKVLGGGYSLGGSGGVVKKLVVKSSYASAVNTWSVRVVEGTSTSDSWSVTVSAVCATA